MRLSAKFFLPFSSGNHFAKKKIERPCHRICGSTKNFVGIYNFEMKNSQRYIDRLFIKKPDLQQIPPYTKPQSLRLALFRSE